MSARGVVSVYGRVRRKRASRERARVAAQRDAVRAGRFRDMEPPSSADLATRRGADNRLRTQAYITGYASNPEFAQRANQGLIRGSGPTRACLREEEVRDPDLDDEARNFNNRRLAGEKVTDAKGSLRGFCIEGVSSLLFLLLLLLLL